MDVELMKKNTLQTLKITIMKTYRYLLVLFALFAFQITSAQRGSNATVYANNSDISDNLDLQAVASVFGDSRDLEDFEKKLNDPSMQLSNLDLNGDGYVDYLRVIEVAEGNNRVIVIQSVLGQDQFQDVATIEIEKQRSNKVYVQIVGNPYIYGPNYIYEPYYYRTPVFFDYFWLATYRPYYSPWYWGYYPTYYSYWAPVPIFTYNRHVYNHINSRNRYVYTDARRLSRADRMYSSVSRSAYERSNPRNSFSDRNSNVTNRYALDNSRGTLRSENGALSRNSSRNIENSRGSGTSNISSRADNGRLEATTTRSNTGRTQASRSEQLQINNNSDRSYQSTNTRVRSDFTVGNARSNARATNNTTTISRNSARVESSNIGNTSRFSTATPQRIERSSSRSNNSYSAPTSSSSNSSFSRSSSSNSSFSRGSSNSSFSRGSSSMSPSRMSSGSMSSGGGRSVGGGRSSGR